MLDILRLSSLYRPKLLPYFFLMLCKRKAPTSSQTTKLLSPTQAKSTVLNSVNTSWQLKGTKTDFKISWKILKQATPYNPASNCCNLCLWQEHFIICRPDLGTLNKRNELITSCRQKQNSKNQKVLRRRSLSAP